MNNCANYDVFARLSLMGSFYQTVQVLSVSSWENLLHGKKSVRLYGLPTLCVFFFRVCCGMDKFKKAGKFSHGLYVAGYFYVLKF